MSLLKFILYYCLYQEYCISYHDHGSVNVLCR